MKRTRTRQVLVLGLAVVTIVGVNAAAWFLLDHQLEATQLPDAGRVCVASMWTAVSQVVLLASFCLLLLAVVAAVLVGPARRRKVRAQAPRWLAIVAGAVTLAALGLVVVLLVISAAAAAHLATSPWTRFRCVEVGPDTVTLEAPLRRWTVGRDEVADARVETYASENGRSTVELVIQHKDGNLDRSAQIYLTDGRPTEVDQRLETAIELLDNDRRP